MSHVQFMDELIREYLVFRGFTCTLKSFDAELKLDKDKAYRPDRIIEQIMHHITNYELKLLLELWAHLNQQLFSKLDNCFAVSVKKMENAVFKLYVSNAIINNRTDKLTEFFTRLTEELQTQPEWKEWFHLPYIKNPEENPIFSLCFSKQWQDTLLVSLHNFLATIFQHMPLPTLLHYEVDAKRIAHLEQRNDSLKKRLTLLVDRDNTVDKHTTPPQIDPPAHLLDDFYVIAQESATSETQVRSLKALVRNMGSGSCSPVVAHKSKTTLFK